MCMCECVCVCDGGVVKILSLMPKVALPLSLSSGEHNPYMTLNSWLTVPPSRVFHPTQNNIVHLPPPPAPPPLDRQRHRLPCACRDTH